jgi:hypothetical protein
MLVGMGIIVSGFSLFATSAMAWKHDSIPRA